MQIQKFKNTELGEIPEEWSIVRIKDIAFINPESINEKYPFKEINYLEIGSITNYEIHSYVNYSTPNRPSRAQRVIKDGDIVVSTVRPYLKGFSLINDQRKNLVCSTGFAVIRPKDKNDTDFLFNYIKSKCFEDLLFKQMEGMAYPAVTSSDVANIILPYPDTYKEKQYIGTILTNVDNLIQKTNQIIDKTQILKKSLMQRLLTKGIEHTKFKNTELGEIPEEWKIGNLGKHVNIKSGEYFSYSEFSEKGIPVLKIDNVAYGRIDWSTKTFLHQDYLKSHSHLILKEGDIVIALNRPITNDQVKVGMIKRKDAPSILYQRVGKFEFITDLLDKHFFFVFLNSHLFKKIISKILIGSDQPYIKTPELQRQKIAFPNLAEQQKIALILTNVDNLIQKMNDKKKNEENMLKGLLQQLLTGKLRVKI